MPLPMPRPAGLGSASLALAQKALKERDDPFQKLFGKRESGIALAYAAADGGVSNDGRSIAGKLPANDGVTAIYDITRAHRLPPRRHQAGGAFGAWREDGRSAPRAT